MNKKQRFLNREDWQEVPVTRVPHLNNLCIPTGYNRVDGVQGNPLLPACIFEDILKETFRRMKEYFADVEFKRLHVKMPYWSREQSQLPDLYEFIHSPLNLRSSSLSIILMQNSSGADSRKPILEYGYDKDSLEPFIERLSGSDFQGIAGNLGYYMTENLIEGILDWTHNKRYPEKFHLNTTKSYLGFYMRRNEDDTAVSSFTGAHPAAIAVCTDGKIEVLPKIEVSSYRVEIAGVCFDINKVNPEKVNAEKVVLFTPGFRSSETEKNINNWKQYAPMIPVQDSAERVNIFISNEGNGSYPVERVLKIWKGAAPIPSFGAVISFAEEYCELLFDGKNIIGSEVKIMPLSGNIDFNDYTQVFGGFVPIVISGKHIYDVGSVEKLKSNMDKYGNALSPIAQAGRETANFDPHIREPAGVFVELEGKFGWVMFDGRHELSIGVSVSDTVSILKKLENEGVLGGKIRNAVFVDGGSAMKAYAVINKGNRHELNLLNRAAAGARNGPGYDPEGLNFYSVLKVPL